HHGQEPHAAAILQGVEQEVQRPALVDPGRHRQRRPAGDAAPTPATPHGEPLPRDTGGRPASDSRDSPLGGAGHGADDSQSGGARRPGRAAARAARASRRAAPGSGTWSGPRPPTRRPGAHSTRSSPASPAPRSAAPRASGLFSDQLLQGLVIQREIRHQPLQPAILMLELPQPPSLIDFKAAVLGLPPVERLLADAVPATELGRLAAGLGLFQDPDDLLFGEPFPTHRGALPAGILSRILTTPVAEFSGSTSVGVRSHDQHGPPRAGHEFP